MTEALNPTLVLLRAAIVAHEVGHMLGYLSAAGDSIPDGETLAITRLEAPGAGWRAQYPAVWAPSTAVDQLIATGCGPVASWVYCELVLRSESSPGPAEMARKILGADSLDLLSWSITDRCASDSDRRTVVGLGAVAASAQYREQVETALKLAGAMGIWLASDTAGQIFAITAHKALLARGRFEIRTGALRELAADAVMHCKGLVSPAPEHAPEPAEAAA
jgi:hypothetical protein